MECHYLYMLFSPVRERCVIARLDIKQKTYSVNGYGFYSFGFIIKKKKTGIVIHLSKKCENTNISEMIPRNHPTVLFIALRK